MSTEHSGEIENVWAKTIEWKDIHISHVSQENKGRKGYFCQSCKKEMQAVKSEIQGRKQFFRHDPKSYLPGEKKCTYSDETFRHKLAKEILQRIKKIKVPAIYKFPPVGVKGQAMFLSEAKFVEAHSVRIELSFYEDDNGKVCWGREISPNGNLLIRPDVAFFNDKGEPVLLIEIVATHKINQDKYLKIKRLGINTVCIPIPKDSAENIEKAFLTSKYIQWVYNYEQESTAYIPTAESDKDGIPSFDELPKRIFTETVSCREFQISELIRRIKICLSASEYRNVEQRIRSELSRVEALTNDLEKQRRELQEGIRNELEEKYRTRRSAIDRAQESLEREEEAFERSFRDGIEKQAGISESDLHGKITALGEKEREADERFLQKTDNLQSQICNYRLQIADIIGEQDAIRKEIDQIQSDIETLPGQTERIQREIDALPRLEEECRGFIQNNTASLNEITNNLKREQERSGELRKDVDGKIAGIRDKLEERYREEERRIVDAVKRRDFSGDDEFARSCKDSLERLGYYKNWELLAQQRNRYEEAIRCIQFMDYKNWHD